MSNTIPPFLCNTPPPIDFDETANEEDNDTEDDFGAFETSDPELGTFNADSVSVEKNKKTNVNLELPLPQEANFSLFLDKVSKDNSSDINIHESETNLIRDPVNVVNFKNECEIIPNKNDDNLVGINELEIKENDHNKFNDYLKDDYETDVVANNLGNYLNVDSLSIQKNREDSPQSLEFDDGNVDHLSEDEDNCSIGDFQNADIVIKYDDDNTSLPSLKFDPVDTQIIKGDTPIFEEENHQSSSATFKQQNEEIKKSSSSLNEIENKLNLSAFQSQSSRDFYSKNNDDINNDDKEELSYKDETKINNVIINNENDDDSDEFDAFESFTSNRTLQTNVNQTNTQENPISINQSEFNFVDVNYTFEADFSQFEEFKNDDISSSLKNNESSNIENKINEEGITKSRLSVDESLYSTQTGKEDQIENNFENDTEEKSNNVNDDEDDFGEFNEFNDFEENKLTATIQNEEMISLENLQDKLKSIINVMFPIEENPNVDNSYHHENNENFNKLETNLNEIDTAKALEYQWLQSNVKNSLIKALGIDSRNILYGDNWNSNMPRFAANLGFGSLEPLKPVKLTTENRTTVTEKSTESKIKSKTGVPAVEFDWNSSGLINPLDASHAHTLLLDLDQLVVVANLDRLKLDSSSSSPCSSFTTNLTTTPTPTIVNITATTFDTANLDNDNHHLNNNVDNQFAASSLLVGIAPSTTTATSTTINCTSTTVTTMSSSSSSTAHLDHNNSSFVENFNEEFFYNNSAVNNHHQKNNQINEFIDHNNDDYNLTKLKFSHYGDVIPFNGDGLNNWCSGTVDTSAGNIDATTITSNNISNIATIQFTNNNNNKNLDINNDFFNQYLDCRVKEILQERKMDEIYSKKSNSDHESNKNDEQQQQQQHQHQQQQQQTNNKTKTIETSTDTTTFVSDIDNDITSSSTSSSSTTKLNYLSGDQQLIQKHNNQGEEIQQKQQQLHKTYSLPLKETHIFTQDNRSRSISINKEINSINNDDNEKCTIDFDYEMAAAGIIINENVVKKEYRDIEYDPKKLISSSNSQNQKDIIYDNDDNDDNDNGTFQMVTTTSHNIMEYCNDKKCDSKNSSQDNNELEKDKTSLQKNDTDEFLNFPIPSLLSSKQDLISNVNTTIKNDSSSIFCDFKMNVSKDNDNLKISNIENIPSIKNDGKINNPRIEKNIQEEGSCTFLITDKNNKDKEEEIEDEFTEFQFASPPLNHNVIPTLQQQKQHLSTDTPKTLTTNNDENQLKLNKQSTISVLKVQNETSRVVPNVVDEMILSPAILLPQTIDIEQSKPEINWPEPGINPEELERLEKMFPQPKSSPHNKPTIDPASSKLNNHVTTNNDDDDWSDFISVPVPMKITTSPTHSLIASQKITTVNNNLNSQYDDEWSDFVYSTPSPSLQQQQQQQQQHHQQFLTSAPISYVSDKFSGLMNSTTWQQGVLPNQFIKATATRTEPISNYYHGNNFIQQQQQQQQQQHFVNGFSSMSSIHNPVNNQNNYQRHHHHHNHYQHEQQQQKYQNQNLIKNPSLIPDLKFVTPKNNIINSTNRSNIPKK